jgi:type I restriction enzyme S subunit
MAERRDVMEEQAVRDASPGYSEETGAASAEGVSPEYKRTEVGVIPEDWSVEVLAHFVSALHAGVSVNSIASDQPVGDRPSVLKTSCIQAGTFSPDQAKPISPKDRGRAKLSPKAETILISRMNTPDLVGESGFVEKDYEYLFLPDRIWMTIFRQAVRFSPRWLAYVLSSPEYRKYLKEIATGTSGSMKNIAKGSLLNLKVPCPAEKEQRAIATALSDADALIESLDRLIAKKRAIKQAAMQQLLTSQTRLPGFTGEWETKRLGDVGTFYKGQGIRRDDVSDEGVPCIRYGEIYTRYGDCVLTPESRIPEAVAEAAFPLRTGDILFAGSGETAKEIGMCVAYLGEQLAFAGGDIVVLRPNEGVSAYLGRLLNHPTIAQQKARLGQGDAVVHISARNLAQIEVHLPKQEEQTAIATVLSDMDAEIEALERRRDKARQIKQGMMQQLLTGRVRLVAPHTTEPAEC